MADITKKYIDLDQLTRYNMLIKQWSNSDNQVAFKTVHKSDDGNNLYFYLKPDAVLGTDEPDATIALGGGDADTKLSALGAIVGATYDSTEEEWSITLDPGFDVSVETVVDALNDLLSKIAAVAADLAALDSTATIATNSAGVVTLKGGLVQTDGLVENAPAKKSTVIEGYLNTTDGKFYEEDTYTTEITLSTANSYKDLTSGVIYNYDGTNLIVTAEDITLAKVATTGTAADVAVVDAGEVLTATNVEDALAELAGTAADKTVYFTDNTSTSGTDYATIYKIYQGSEGSAAAPVAGELVGTINIPKDQFLNDAELVDIYFDDSDDTLHEGSISGPDVTEAIKGAGVTPTAADAGKYFKLVFELTSGPSAKSTIYISIKELSHVYTGGTTDEITVAVDPATDIITATIGKVAATKVIYQAAQAAVLYTQEEYDAYVAEHGEAPEWNVGDVKTPAVAEKNIKTKVDEVEAAIGTAIAGLDTSSDVTIASVNSSTGAITIVGGISETDGVIGNGTGDAVIITPVTSAEIDALFATPEPEP